MNSSSIKTARTMDLAPLQPPDRFAMGEGPRRNPLAMIWHRRWIVIVTTALGVAAAAAAYHFMSPVYTGVAQLVVTQNGAPLSVAASEQSSLNTQCEIITKHGAVHAGALALLEQQGHVRMKSFPQNTNKLTVLKNGLRAKVGQLDDVISVSFEAPTASESADVTNAVVDAYVNFCSAQKQNSAKDTLERISQNKKEWETQVAQQNRRLLELKTEIERLTADGGQNNIEVQRLKTLSEALTQSQLETIDAKQRFDSWARTAINDPMKLDALVRHGSFGGKIIVPANDEQVRSELYAAQQRLNELQERYLPNHPMVQSTRAQVDELNARYGLYLYQRWTGCSERLRSLEASYDDQQHKAKQLQAELAAAMNAKASQYSDLQSEKERNEKMLNLLVSRMNEVRLTDTAQPINIEVVSRATPPDAPTRPMRSTLLFEGLLAGLVLGISLTYLDTRLRSVDEITHTVGLPILAVIPHMPRGVGPGSRGRKVHLDPMSDVAEAYRHVRTAVYFGPRAKTVLITSAIRNEGKSTLASNLAIAMAEAGQHVLLVDADLREPTQHRLFAIGNDVGLSSVVAGRTPVDRAIQSASIKNLDVLPCGPVPFNPSETINNQTFADMLNDLAGKYDYIVVDAPPVMPVTDARILGAMCDVTLLVLRAERSTRTAAMDARDGLLGFGANLLGVVVNDGPRHKRRYGYYGGYGLHRGGGSGGFPSPASSATTGSGASARTSVANGDRLLASSSDLILMNANRR